MIDFSIPAVEFSEQWQQPQYVVPLLLIVGGDLVALALAQLAGGLYTAIPFSLGWVSYSVSVLFATFAGKRLMPPQPDHSCVVVNGSSGFVTENTSWILGRLVRDFESWMESQTRDRLIQLRQWKDRRAREDSWDVAENYMSLGNLRSIGLCVSVYEPDFTYKAGVPKVDYAYSTNIMMVVFQLAIASVPFAVSGDWGVLLITGGGILLASITAALPQWRREKWNCRPKSRKTVVLTRGRGSQHAIVILGNRHGLDFEDLARGPEHIHPRVLLSTRIVLAIIALLSIALLICAAGKQQSIWYLLATLGLGTVQTQFLAIYPRNPSAFGIHLRFITVIGNPRVMNTLFEVEEKYPGVGSSLLPIYFGEDLTEEESRRWEFLREKAKATKHQREMDEKDRRDKQRELYELAQRVPKKGKEPSERLSMALA